MSEPLRYLGHPRIGEELPTRLNRMGGSGVAIDPVRRNLWDCTKTRQRHRCSTCGEWIPKGSEAWRPVTEGKGTRRSDRLCLDCGPA